MVAFSKVYNPGVYNGLGRIEVVAKLVNEESIKGLGAIIEKYGHAENLNIQIAHRHFPLANNEAMLEKSAGDSVIAKPAQLVEIENANGQPNVLALGMDADGNWKWFPVNYTLDQGIATSVLEDQAFLVEAANYLVENGLFNRIMLSGRDRHMVAKRTLEMNYEKTRTSVISPLKDGELIPADGIPTTFFITKEDDGSGGICIGCDCCSHCKSHK